jgi:hypothetical protein
LVADAASFSATEPWREQDAFAGDAQYDDRELNSVLDAIELQRPSPPSDPAAPIATTWSMPSQTSSNGDPEDEEILLPEDYEAIAFLADEEADDFLNSANNQPPLNPEQAKKRARDRRRKGKKASDEALAQLDSKDQWFGLPKIVGEIYNGRGISQPHPWQQEVLSNTNLLSGRNFIVSQPTSAGKVRELRPFLVHALSEF